MTDDEIEAEVERRWQEMLADEEAGVVVFVTLPAEFDVGAGVVSCQVSTQGEKA
jgi:hypothetical protein